MTSNQDEVESIARLTGLTREKVVQFLPEARKVRISTPGITLADAVRQVAGNAPSGGRQQNGYFTK